ncbi:5,6-dimethylbenzimidazole synthase [Sulfolobus acidocaldarius]|uniref:NADH dehydrogenase n=4 Tax=Sulfolobus acidocaldarius TaxID=2285 RepID=Q4JC12_SULAC|nr:5,6-dimethylbenzimidazole synthase [Sulfolobus acidocaldarius]AAY79667.1 NADH dehydrogenase [Sulfolobus acidocaldarius DSM 639]AGE70225.1 NADH dehydrogenase [Sulfolobus acidocaldarius N8]AGE72500.1 NADH dehydrogenase [Sulfolobus acidocaldarius Ron12/I]ALU29369.1 5,6-dimethylbenzimidazole synthase [Sulfolobus acidocaldarius]ALU32098.1 5,6-dimethylbenzimidazole synthase [Sulfolobus acidocaldarius]
MDLYEAIKKRRDVRSYYRKDPIPDEVLAKILMAAHLAPSVGFSQPWNFIIIRDIEKRKKIKELVQKERENFRQQLSEERKEIFDRIKIEAILDTPINIAVTCDPQRFGPNVLGRSTMPYLCQYSTVLAIENLWLASTAEGIGVGWVSFFHKEDVKRILNIPDSVDLVAYLTLGYVTHFPDRPELEEKGWLKRLPLEDLVFEDEYGKRPSDNMVLAIKNVKL